MPARDGVLFMEGGHGAAADGMSGRTLSRQMDQALDEASAWIVRLQTGDADDAVAFDAWLGAAAVNRQAYDQALAVWTAYAAAAPQVLAALEAQDRPQLRPAGGRRAWPPVGGLAAAAAVLAAVLLTGPVLRPTAARTYATGVGQRTSVRLADGTRIDLNADTQLTVALAKDARRVTLTQGEAIFEVAHDPARPFLVAAGDRTILDVGTQFDVRRRDGLLAVTVTRGVVDVRPADDAPGPAYRLHPGQQLERREGAAATTLRAAAAEAVLGWREGRLVFHDQPLNAVIAELNHQFRRPIRLQDPALGARRVSGVLVLDDEAAVVQRLAWLAPVRPVVSRDSVVLHGTADR